MPFCCCFLVLYWSLQGKMAQFRMFKFICEVKTSVVQILGALDATFNTGPRWYGQQFPCILRVAPTKGLLKCCALCSVSPSLKENMNLIIRSIQGKEGKRTKEVQILAFVVDFLQQYYKNLYLNLLSLAWQTYENEKSPLTYFAFQRPRWNPKATETKRKCPSFVRRALPSFRRGRWISK